MSNTVFRIAAAVVVVIVVGVGAYLLKEHKEVQPPDRELATIPMELGDWRGEETPIANERKEEAIGADSMINRLYRDAKGHAVSLHVASFVEFSRSLLHSPMLCYPGNGFTQIGSEDVALPGIPGEPVKVKLATFQMNDRSVFVVFWYQLGEHVCLEMEDLAAARQNLRPRSNKWPSLLKFLLETTINDPDEDQARILDFAAKLYQQTKDLQGTSFLDPDVPEKPATSAAADADAK